MATSTTNSDARHSANVREPPVKTGGSRFLLGFPVLTAPYEGRYF